MQDIEAIDPTYYNSLKQMLKYPLEMMGLELTFTAEVEEWGAMKEAELVKNGSKIDVTDENKLQYVQLLAAHKMTYSIKDQITAFLDGFYMQVPRELMEVFNEHELELLISGLPTIDGACRNLHVLLHRVAPLRCIGWLPCAASPCPPALCGSL